MSPFAGKRKNKIIFYEKKTKKSFFLHIYPPLTGKSAVGLWRRFFFFRGNDSEFPFWPLPLPPPRPSPIPLMDLHFSFICDVDFSPSLSKVGSKGKKIAVRTCLVIPQEPKVQQKHFSISRKKYLRLPDVPWEKKRKSPFTNINYPR